MDVSHSNGIFTWFGTNSKKSRLDRALINVEWNLTGPWVTKGLERRNSDHRPILLSCESSNWGPRPFRIFNCWLENEKLIHTLESEWKRDSHQNIHQKLKHLREQVRHWNKTDLGNIDNKIKLAEENQEKADNLNWSDELKVRIKANLDELYKTRASMLWQKARTQWQLQGEKNTRFFHNAIVRNRRKLAILSIYEGDNLVTNPTDIKRTFYNHFKTFF